MFVYSKHPGRTDVITLTTVSLLKYRYVPSRSTRSCVSRSLTHLELTVLRYLILGQWSISSLSCLRRMARLASIFRTRGPRTPAFNKAPAFIIGLYILPLTVWVYLHSNRSGRLHKTIFSSRVRFCRSRSSEVVDFVINRKRVCDFL